MVTGISWLVAHFHDEVPDDMQAPYVAPPFMSQDFDGLCDLILQEWWPRQTWAPCRFTILAAETRTTEGKNHEPHVVCPCRSYAIAYRDENSTFRRDRDADTCPACRGERAAHNCNRFSADAKPVFPAEDADGVRRVRIAAQGAGEVTGRTHELKLNLLNNAKGPEIITHTTVDGTKTPYDLRLLVKRRRGTRGLSGMWLAPGT